MELRHFEHVELKYHAGKLGEFSLAHIQVSLHFNLNEEKPYTLLVAKWLDPTRTNMYSFYDLEDALSTFELLYYTNEEALGTINAYDKPSDLLSDEEKSEMKKALRNMLMEQ